MTRRPPTSPLFPYTTLFRSYGRIARMLKAAKRPAFATSFEAGGPTGAYIARQWANKHLQLIAIPGADPVEQEGEFLRLLEDRKSTRLNSSHANISYAVFCLK